MTDDVEVARYALRTFSPNPRIYSPALRVVPRYIRTEGVTETPRELLSVSMSGSHWTDGTCEARCLDNKPHQAPDDNCRCGIYGTLNLPALIRQYRDYADKLVTVIAAEGKTIIGDVGLRTQYARVVAYWSPDLTILKICELQFANAQYFDDLSEMLAAYHFPPQLKLPITTITTRIDSNNFRRLLSAHPAALWWRQRVTNEMSLTSAHTVNEISLSWIDPSATEDETITVSAVRTSQETRTEDLYSWGSSIIRTYPYSSITYIDVLCHEKPTTGFWGTITQPGDHVHPSDRKNSNSIDIWQM